MGKGNLTVITSYPKRGEIHSTQTVGVASYSKQLLSAFKRVYPEIKVKVVAEVFDKKEKYSDGLIEVERFWHRKSFLDVFKLFILIAKEEHKNILISLEANMFSTSWHTLIFLINLAILRLLGKEITLILHQVLSDFSVVEKNIFKARLLNLIYLKPYYFLVFLASSKVIVFEEALREGLSRKANIYTLSHLIPQNVQVEKSLARKKLGLALNKKYSMCFGYISPYKGIEHLITNWPKETGFELIVAGGINPNHKNNPKIVKYVAGIERVAKLKGILVTGFIKEADLHYYFSAVDLVVLPYVTFMSSSGPLSLALSFEKPVILDRVLAGYAMSQDFNSALKESGLTIDDLVYDRNLSSMADILVNTEDERDKFEKFARILSRMRNPEIIGKQLGEILAK